MIDEKEKTEMSRCTARKGLEARHPGTDWTTVIYP